MDLLDIKILLFGSEELEDIPFASKSPGDTAKVIKLPVHIGLAIKELDSTEALFHVEECSNGEKAWTEVWTSYTWKESNARLARIRTRSESERKESVTKRERIAQIINALPARFKEFQKVPGYAELLSAQILENWKDNNCTEILKLMGVYETLKSFEEQDNENKL